MTAEPPTYDELAALIRLLDDETPEVRAQVKLRLSLCGGDLSEWLATQDRVLTRKERSVLVNILGVSRRQDLINNWMVPSGGISALREDWDTFEALLRTLSDFLHDGITLRQPLSDALDLLAEDATDEGVLSASDLSTYLFEGDRLTGNTLNYYDPRNSDLAWCLEQGYSNPIGLSVIFILIAKRLQLEVEGVNFPGHFMCRIYEEGYPIIIDCFSHGKKHPQSLLLENPELNRFQRSILTQACDPGTILLRLLNNLKEALEREKRNEDCELIQTILTALS